MAIDPPSDVVLEVARAADPARAAAAAQRLNALAAAAGQQGGFAQTLAQTTPAQPSIAGLANARSALTDPDSVASAKAAKAKVEFEAVLLNSFIKEMMPKDASSTFGQGLAGDMWKSMLAEQVAHQIAKSGKLGIATRLFAAHPLSAGQSLEHATRLRSEETHDAAQMSANGLSLPSSVNFDEGSVLFADRKRS
jgi:Rod binding domain-containing protein